MLIRRLLTAVCALLAMPERMSRKLREVKREIEEIKTTAKKYSGETEKKYQSETESLRREIAALHDEVRERLLQYHLQLGRLEGLANGAARPPLGRRVPAVVSAERVRAGAPATSDRAAGVSDEWLALSACPACSTADRTIVCEWNKLILLDTAPDERAARYDYAVCHGCGILYATQRPVGARYRYLVDHFEDVTDKDASNPLLNPYPLTDEDRARYRELIARGVFVSDHDGGDYLSGVFKDRLANAGHVDILGSLLNPRGARILEVRPRAGTILEGLRRHYGADVHAMAIWESQQFIVREMLRYSEPCTRRLRSLLDSLRRAVRSHSLQPHVQPRGATRQVSGRGPQRVETGWAPVSLQRDR